MCMCVCARVSTTWETHVSSHTHSHKRGKKIRRHRDICSQAAGESPITAGCSINLRANYVRNELTVMRPRPRHRGHNSKASATSTSSHSSSSISAAPHLIKKLHAPRCSHLIHTVEINPQINAFDGHQNYRMRPPGLSDGP